MGWQCDSEAEIIFTSRMEEFDQFLEVYCPPEDWRCIFTDIPVRTDSEVKASARKNFHEQARSIKLLKIFLLIWIVGLPTSVMLLVFFGPEWLGMIALALALIESARASLRLWGAYQPSKREQEANELQRRKDHYYFHCEKNPDGFLRLRNENFERDAKEEIRFESEKLKALTDKKAEDFRE